MFTGIKHYVKRINHKCKLKEYETFPECKGLPECEESGNIKFNYGENYDRIKFISNDNLPIEKLIYFPAITFTIRCIFKNGAFFYPQVYLDDPLYQL